MSEDAIRVWKEIMIFQICSGSCSFAASSLIVTFIAINGLVTPYRRIIFGLSVSDMFQSFAILAGPFLIQSDTPMAIWGIGNMSTCHFDGFLYYAGLTATPMYTVFLCVYYVYKLKNRMSDAQFTQRMEKKVHAAIIMTTVGLCLTALGMKVINPSALGNSCGPASMPTGCNQNPELYGECDPNIQQGVKFFLAFGIGVVPAITLVGIIICMGLIFWHMLMRERIFGTRGNKRPTRTAEQSSNVEMEGNVLSFSSSRSKRRKRYLRSSELASYDEESSSSRDESSLFIVEERQTHHIGNIDHNIDDDDDNAVSKNLTSDDSHGVSNRESSTYASISVNAASSNTPQLPRIQDAAPSLSKVSGDCSNGGGISVNAFSSTASIGPNNNNDAAVQNTSKVSENWSNCGGISVDIFPSEDFISSVDNQLLVKIFDNDIAPPVTTTPHTTNADLETLSRLYKKELLLQVCCYVLVFCLTTMPYIILCIKLLNGTEPSKNLLRTSATLYPLAGFFNIIVYTRWNVTSWRRKHPECSRLRAFYLVLKAGGDLPSEGTEVEEGESAS